MAVTDRYGLLGLAAVVNGDGNTLAVTDYNQLPRYMAAAMRLLAELLDSDAEGIVSGGADAIGDFGGSGTEYPPVTLMVKDDSGIVHPFVCTSNKPITGLDAIADGTATTLYAIPQKQSGVSPAAAVGGLTAVTFLAQATATAAPADSLVLGAGNVTGNAFTTWTPAAGAPVDGLTAKAHAASHQHGGADEIATATPGANAVPKAGGTGKLAVGWLPTGSGNGLDADTVDTVHASALARRAGSPTAGHLAGLDADGDPTDSGIVATDVSGHLANTSNPHSVTAAQLGVGTVYGELYPTSDVTIANYTGSPHYLDFTTNWTRSLTGLSWSSGDPTKIAVLSSGLYQLDMCLSWSVNATGYRIGGWDINGTMQPRIAAAVTGQYTSSQQAMTVRLTAGQYLRVGCWQNSGGDLTLRGFSTITRLYIARIAP